MYKQAEYINIATFLYYCLTHHSWNHSSPCGYLTEISISCSIAIDPFITKIHLYGYSYNTGEHSYIGTHRPVTIECI